MRWVRTDGAAGAPVANGGSTTGGSSGTDNTASIARGAALATTYVCVSCHQSDYSGAGHYPNITPDIDNGIGTWTDDEIKRAITQGVSKDGSKLKPPMGFHYYATVSAADLDAIVA